MRTKRSAVWLIALWMTVTIFGALLFENRQYLFATKLYENGDWAADSLMVREAKHTLLLHGHYSRWHFYHPGPALLDTLAVGEVFFYDALHLVPTPYNGQLLSLCFVMTLAFSLALSIYTRRLGAAGGEFLFFLPLGLLFAALHFEGVGVQVFLDAWPAFPPVMVFLCFVVAVAAVASGSGRELPVVAAAGGWLVHNSAAQPLFVLPLALLAYGGLLHAGQTQRERDPGGSGRWSGLLTSGWRAFPLAHAVAAIVLALFILPLALDAAHGGDSNFARILEHLRAHRHEPGKSWFDSLGYFLVFGGYDTFRTGHGKFEYSGAELWAYLRLHWRAYTLWLITLAGAPTLFLAARRRPGNRDESGDGPRSKNFVRWFYVILAAAGGLTLVWGTKQDGPLYYYNAYFNYSIYFGFALGFAAALAVALMSWTDCSSLRRTRPFLSALLWLGTVATVIAQADRFQTFTFGAPEDAAMADTVKRAAATLPAGTICYVDWLPWNGLKSAVAVALELARLGKKARVSDNWEIMFGRQNTIQTEKIDTANVPLVRWLVLLQNEDPARLNRWPLLFGCALATKSLPTLNPAGMHISFASDGNYRDFAVFGWSTAGSSWSYSDTRTALLAFHPLPLPPGADGGVDVSISAWTLPPPGKTDPQRAVIEFNGATIATVYLPIYRPGMPPVQVRIGATLWQDAVTKDQARLVFRFPDATSPASLNLGTDYRLIGGGFRNIEFQPTPVEAGNATPPAGTLPPPTASQIPGSTPS